MQFRGAYRSQSPHFTECVGESMAQQHFANEVNINSIVSRYKNTGMYVDPARINQSRIPQYGDFSDVLSFQEAQNQIAEAQQMFAQLPSHLRYRFHNNPAELIDFVMDSDNYDEAVKLGLVPKKEVKDVNIQGSQNVAGTPAPVVTGTGDSSSEVEGK